MIMLEGEITAQPLLANPQCLVPLTHQMSFIIGSNVRLSLHLEVGHVSCCHHWVQGLQLLCFSLFFCICGSFRVWCHFASRLCLALQASHIK